MKEKKLSGEFSEKVKKEVSKNMQKNMQKNVQEERHKKIHKKMHEERQKKKQNSFTTYFVYAMAAVIGIVLLCSSLTGKIVQQESGYFAAAAGETYGEAVLGERYESGQQGAEEDSKTENMTESERESETEAESERESETEAESERESETEAESESESETEAETERESETEAETERESGTEAESGRESETEAERGRESETEAESENESETEAESGRESETEVEHQSESETETETESVSESSSEYESGSGAEADAGNEDRPETGAEHETEPGSEFITELTAEQDTEHPSELLTEQPETVPEAEKETEQIQPERTQPEQTQTEKLPEKIQRGIHYEIIGDQNAWYRDSNDTLWVRPGSSLYIETKQESGYRQGTGKTNIQTDGQLTFSLKKTDEQGKVVSESEIRSESYYVDAEAPTAEIGISGVLQEGVVYAAQAADVTIHIAPDGKSGLRKAAYVYMPCKSDGTLLSQPEENSWQECRDGEQLRISEEGTFQVYVRTEDQVGNSAFSRSGPVCVDRTPPEIEIQGVGDQTANSGTVSIRVNCSDSYYKAGSLQVDIVGANEGKVPRISKKQENSESALIEYYDFPQKKGYDDVYKMNVQAEDSAGNMTQKQIQFSINRFGSVYDLGKETKTQLEKYFLSEPADIVFCETNIDYVGESSIFCRCDGTLRELVRGTDYQVTMQGSRNSWKQYQYTIPADYFQKEGVYEILLTSSDKAKNSSDTQMQEKRVTFVLDWTSPGCTVTGVEAQKVYQADRVTAFLTPYDNTEVRTMKVYLDSKLIWEDESGMAGEQTKKVELDAADSWQTLQIYLKDPAGNEFWSEELPVFVNNNGAKPETYRKTRPSAMELEQKKTEENPEEGESGEGEEEAQNSSAKGSEAVSGQTVEPLNATGKNAWGKGLFAGKEGADYSGTILFLFGIGVFFITAIACLYTGFRRKK